MKNSVVALPMGHSSLVFVTGKASMLPSVTSMSDTLRNLLPPLGMQVHDAALGARWSAFLKLHYPQAHAAKLIARDFRCAPRTATSWLAGQSPRPAALRRAGELFGLVAAMRLLFPDFQEVTSSALLASLDDMRAQLTTLRQELVGKPCTMQSHGGKRS